MADFYFIPYLINNRNLENKTIQKGQVFFNVEDKKIYVDISDSERIAFCSNGNGQTEGSSITNIEINNEGYLIITLSDGNTLEAGPIIGQKGEKGDKGDPFSISKVYTSIAEMNANFETDNVPEGGFVIIETGNINDLDNAKLFVKSSSSYEYITDLSGINGIQGPKGEDGISATHSWDGTTLTITSASAISSANLKGDKGDTGPAGNNGKDGISVFVSNVLESNIDGGDNVITFSDGKTVTIKNGTQGSKGNDGRTPIKGEDYYTDAEKAEIVAELVTQAEPAGAVSIHNQSDTSHNDIRNSINQVVSDVTDIKNNTTGIIPEYWNNHLNERIEIIKALQNEGDKDCFSFIVISDIHYEQNIAKLSPALAKKVADECGIKYILVLGDSNTRNGILKDLEYMDNEWINIEKMLTPIRDRLLITDGNHDGSYGATDGDGDGVTDNVHGPGNSAFNYTPEKKYNYIKRKVGLIENVTFDESGCGYYVDDKAAKVRYIILSTHNNKYEENEDGSSKYSNMNNFRYGQSQFDMVIKALNTLEDGWSILVASHVPLDRSGELLHWGGTEMLDNYLTNGEVECWVMADVLNAFVNKTTYKGQFAGNQGGGASYINLADTTSADWVIGGRINSSGTITMDDANARTTNYIPYTHGDVITIKGLKLGDYRLCIYASDKSYKYCGYHSVFARCITEGDDGVIYFDTAPLYDIHADARNGSYIRFSALEVSGVDPIITTGDINATSDAFDAVSVDVDFTNAKGTLIGYFGGHLHKDGVWGTSYTWDGRLKQCDFYTATTRSDAVVENKEELREERIEGTTTEQSFNVFTVNRATNTVNITKIGAGTLETPSFVYPKGKPGIDKSNTETWIFTLEDGSTVAKKVVLS